MIIVPSAPEIKKRQTDQTENDASETADADADNNAPDFTTGDPNNPVDQKKLREYIKKKQQNAQKQIREATRRRAERNSPPVPLPTNEENKDN